MKSWVLLIWGMTWATLLDAKVVTPQASQGVLDLRQYSFVKYGATTLDGQWQLYWQELLRPDELAQHEPSGYVQVPGTWDAEEVSSAVSLSPSSFATYRLKVLLPSLIDQVFLRIPELPSSYQLYANGELVAQRGEVGSSERNSKVGRGTAIAIVNLPDDRQLDLVLNISGFFHKAGGIWFSPSLGNPVQEVMKLSRKLAFEGFVIGVLLIMALYHIGLYFLRRRNRSALYFGLFCFVVSLRAIAMSDGNYLFEWLGDEYSDWYKRLEYLTLCTASSLMYSFFISLFPDEMPKLLEKVLWCITAMLLAILLVTSQKFYGQLLPLMQAYIFIPTLVAIGLLVWAWRHQRDGALLSLLGYAFIAITTVNDILYSRHMIDTFYAVPIGIFGYVFFQATLVARHFAQAFFRAEEGEKTIRQLHGELKEHAEGLDRLVYEKTKDIRSIMTHIKIGIFTISGEKFAIQKDYSDHLKDLFHQDNLEGKNGCDLLFDRSHLTSDERSQAVSALDIAIGSNILMFDSNSHCLPGEIHFEHLDGQMRVLEISWNPIANENDDVDKILITVRDVTELRQLEEEAQDKKEELQFIGELVNVSAESFWRFIHTCEDFVSENRKLLRASSIHKKDMEVLKVLFINMHTMKGAARSLYFKKMTRIFHDVEQYYARLQKDPNANWDIEKMLSDLDEIERIITTYKNINRDKLGRTMTNERRVELTEVQTQEIYGIFSEIGRKLEATQLAIDAQKLNDINRLLFCHIYVSVEEVLNDCCRYLPTLAKDLGKAAPTVEIKTENLFLTSPGEELLRRVMMHILRNAMDHGIEKPQQRLNKGKQRVGKISIEMKADNDAVSLMVSDDGQGLNLEKIVHCALKNGLIASADGLSRQAKAELIFCSGLSTASTVSDVSGRGVGMDAVRNYLRQAGGDINLILDSAEATPCVLTDQKITFKYEIRLGLSCFAQEKNPPLFDVA
jgi:signal transduction histidine kinase